MLTLLLQCLNTLLHLAFGAVALAVVRHSPPLQPAKRLSWQLAGSGFLIGGLHNAVQDTFGVSAFVAGPDSALWAEYLRWAPTLNLGRGAQFVVLAAALAGAVALRPVAVQRYARAAVGAMLGVLLLVSLVVYHRPESLDLQASLTGSAVLGTIELLLFLAALLAALLTHSIERHLWLALLVYSVREAIDVIWISAFAVLGRQPVLLEPSHRAMLGSLVFASMVVLVALRLRAVKRGTADLALLEQKEASRFSTLR
jgi:hypothetical protein